MPGVQECSLYLAAGRNGGRGSESRDSKGHRPRNPNPKPDTKCVMASWELGDKQVVPAAPDEVQLAAGGLHGVTEDGEIDRRVEEVHRLSL